MKTQLTALFFAFLLVSPVGLQAADAPVTLKYTYRPETTQVPVLHDIQGKTYLPLVDVAQFYGIQTTFDSQTRKVTLVKGKSQVKLILSQPVFMTIDTAGSYPVEPVEVISGQLGITPEWAEDFLGSLLHINVSYLAD